MPENTEMSIVAMSEEVINLGTELVSNYIESNTTESENTLMFHFLSEYPIRKKNSDGVLVATGEKYVVRTLSTMFKNDAEEAAYNASLIKKAPVNGVFALNTGDYLPRLLLERAANRGVDFRLLIFSNEDLANLGDVKSYIGKFNFAWANADFSFFIKFDGFDAWGLDLLGLNVKFNKKTSKRANELVRFTGHSLYSATGEDFLFTRTEDMNMVNIMGHGAGKYVIAEYSTPVDGRVTDFDGVNFCTRRFANALGLRGDRFNFRLNFKSGGIKGDLIVVPDARMLNGADVVYHTDNFNTVITTSGFVIVTAENHSPFHKATYDIQSTVNNPAVYHAQAMLFDIKKMEAEAKAIIVTGEMPEWMELKGTTEGLGGVDTSEFLNLASDNRAMHVRWQQAGMDIQSSQNLMFMGLSGVIQMMQRNWNGKLKAYKKTYVPMTNATRAAVMTVEALENMGGYTVANREVLSFVDGIGAVMPGSRFAATFDLHGTWDLDDSAIFRLIRLYSSNQGLLEVLVAGGVIDPALVIPESAEDAVQAIAVVRSPNGPGEYSIEACDMANLPFEVVEENVISIDVASLPLGQGSLLEMVATSGLPQDSNEDAYGVDFALEHAQYMITSQTINPGIGSLANSMMCWVNVMGVNFPSSMTDVFGEMVDAVQQGFSLEQLTAVDQESGKVYEQLVDAMIADPSLTIDEDLCITRMPLDVQAKIPASQIVAGRISTFNAMYRGIFELLNKLSGEVTKELRNKSDLATRIGRLQFDGEVYNFCDRFYNVMTQSMAEVDNQYRVNAKDSSFAKIMKQHYRSVALRNVIDNALVTLEDMGSKYFVCMYFVCLPNVLDRKFATGRFDRLLFQTGTNGLAIADRIAELANR